MQVSEAIEKLQTIQRKYGNVSITGGHMYDGIPLNRITLTDNSGAEVWPEDMSVTGEDNEIEGIVLS